MVYLNKGQPIMSARAQSLPAPARQRRNREAGTGTVPVRMIGRGPRRVLIRVFLLLFLDSDEQALLRFGVEEMDEAGGEGEAELGAIGHAAPVLRRQFYGGGADDHLLAALHGGVEV